MDKVILASLVLVFFFLDWNLIIGRSTSEILLKILFIYIFLFGVLEYYEILGFFRKFMIDILMVFLILAQIQKKKYKLPGIKWFLLISCLIFISSFISLSGIYPTFTYFRTFLYPYIIFLSVYNLRMNEERWFKFNRFIFSLFILQIAASVYKLIFIGVNEKYMIGTLSTSGGAFSTMLPLASIAFIIAFFIIQNQDLKYVMLIIGFLFMGYMGAKRGIWIYTPVILLIAIFYYNKVTTSVERIRISKRMIGLGVFVILFSAIILVLGSKYTRTLNPENKVGGSFDLDYLQDYMVEYTFSASEDEAITQGRGANFFSVARQMIVDNSINSWFGFGPESGKGVRTYGEGIWSYLKVNGPVTGLTYHLVQIGFIANILILLMAFKIASFILKIAKTEKSRYWKSFCFGSFMIIVVFIADYISYSSSFIATIFPLSFSAAYILALAAGRKNIQIITSYQNVSCLSSGDNRYSFI